LTLVELAKYRGEFGQTIGGVKFELNLLADEVTDESELSEMYEEEDAWFIDNINYKKVTDLI